MLFNLNMGFKTVTLQILKKGLRNTVVKHTFKNQFFGLFVEFAALYNFFIPVKPCFKCIKTKVVNTSRVTHRISILTFHLPTDPSVAGRPVKVAPKYAIATPSNLLKIAGFLSSVDFGPCKQSLINSKQSCL